MESLITFFIFLAVIIIGIIIANKKLPEPIQSPPKNKNDFQINGVNIHLSDEEIREIERIKKKEEHERFIKAKNSLVSEINMDFECTTDLIRKKVLEELLNRKIESIDDFVQLDFLYNDGKLRSNEEADFMKRYFKYQKERENYDAQRHKINTLAFIIPFVAVFIITCIAMNDIIMGPLLGLFFGLIAAFIGMTIGYSTNIENAEEYGLSNDDPRVREEILKRRAAITSIIGTSVITGHHAKQAVKDLLNVDGWSEMK